MLLPSHDQPNWLLRRRCPAADLRRHAWLAAASLAAGLLAGCTAPVAKPAAPVPAGVSYSPATLDNLRKGMPAAEVIAQWGKPEKQEKLESPAGFADIWIYHHVVRSNQRQVATSTQLVPVFDSLSNGVKSVPEPIYSEETVETVRRSELLMFQDRLVEWKASEEIRKRLN